MSHSTRRTFLQAAGGAAALAAATHARAHDEDDMSTRPNILLFYPDQHRFDWVGEGSDVPARTPHLDALDRRGVRFAHALTPAPLCAPARACLAAGKEYDRCRVPSNGTDYPLDQTTVYTLLRESGYHVIGCGKFDLHKASPIWGIEGKTHLAEWGFSDGVDNAGKWDAINSGRKRPRDPWDVTRRMKGLYRGVEFPPPNGGRKLSAEQHNAVRQNYAAMVENIDRWLGLYIRHLRERGELENTLIVFSSDHGEMLGDHGMWGKNRPHQPSVGVPLTIAGPGIRQGHVHRGPATTLDLTATFLEAAGLEVPEDMDSRSLLPLLRGDAEGHRTHVFSGMGKWRLVYDGRYKLVRGSLRGRMKGKDGGPGLRLFDLQEDPGENQDLAEAKPDLVRELNAQLDANARR